MFKKTRIMHKYQNYQKEANENAEVQDGNMNLKEAKDAEKQALKKIFEHLNKEIHKKEIHKKEKKR